MPLRTRFARLLQRVRLWLEARGAYQSLAILAIPLIIVEPAKLVALAILGGGHWLSGVLVMLAAYGLGISVVERIFWVVKPKLMTLGWFAKAWNWFTATRTKAMALMKR